MNGKTLWTVLVIAGAVMGAPVEEYQLRFVAFVHRHGDRSPVGTYPTDPYRNETLWNNGWGELTNQGKRTAHELGKWLRERYGGFIPKIYNKRDYEAQSTDVSRTLMSAYLVLAGLYEPLGTDIWNENLKWQPIPVHTIPREMDNVLAASKPCPRHSQLFARLLMSPEVTNKINGMSETLTEVAKHAGYNGTDPLVNFFLVGMVADSLYVQSHNGMKLPNWTEPYFPEPLQSIASLNLKLPTYNQPLRRLSCGMLVKEILGNLKAKAKGYLSKKMWHYSAHDITIVGFKQCLNIVEKESPPYGSTLLVELRSKNNENFVNILYRANGQTTTLVVPGCTEFCPLEKFEELVKPIIPENWDLECQPLVY